MPSKNEYKSVKKIFFGRKLGSIWQIRPRKRSLRTSISDLIGITLKRLSHISDLVAVGRFCTFLQNVEKQ
jgi:hypothetical protein